MKSDLLNMKDEETRIFRTFSMERFKQVLLDKELTFVLPSAWDDPFENLIARCAIIDKSKIPWSQSFLDQTRRPVYGQCWSLAKESDALWRIYSKIDKDQETGRNRIEAVNSEGVKVRSSIVRLMREIQSSKVPFAGDLYVGRVEYFEEDRAIRKIIEAIGQYGIKAFSDTAGHAKSLLIKRQAFDHEQEVRALYVSSNPLQAEKYARFAVNPSSLFEEVILDPRLGHADVQDRIFEIRSAGYEGPVVQSQLYQGILLEIVVNHEP